MRLGIDFPFVPFDHFYAYPCGWMILLQVLSDLNYANNSHRIFFKFDDIFGVGCFCWSMSLPHADFLVPRRVLSYASWKLSP